MKIDKDTKLFYSLSSNPGNFGATFFNYLFEHFGINAIYKPLKLRRVNEVCFYEFMNQMDKIGIDGISISMPFKKDAYNYIQDTWDLFGDNKIKNINTICKIKDPYECYDFVYKGFNTDVNGFENACEPLLRMAKTAVVIGRGAYSDSIIHVLNKRKIAYICLDSRDKRSLDIVSECGNDLLINVSPIGMEEIEDKYFTENNVNNFKYVFDCVVSPKGKRTNLIDLAIKLNKLFVRGNQAAFECAIQQSKIYLSDLVDEEWIPKRLLKEHMNNNGYEV